MLEMLEPATVDVAPNHVGGPSFTVENRRFDRWARCWRALVIVNVAALLTTAVWFRGRELSRIPGVNGDEAWYGVQAELVLHGQPISWRTPTGNLLNPFFFGPLLLTHAIWTPSFGLLRATALISGLLALLVNLWLCHGVFGRRVAWISTLILAILPINIVYSRLAWDASQSVLATLPAIYWPLRAIVDPRHKVRWSGLGLAALAVAILVHPTNLFVSAITGVCLGFAWREELRGGERWLSWHRLRSAGIGTWIVFVACGGIAAGGLWLAGPRLGPALARCVDVRQDVAFIVDFGRFFSGVTVYEYISGSLAQADGRLFSVLLLPWDATIWLVLFLLARGLCKRLAARHLVEWCLLFGWGVGLVVFYLLGGPDAIGPNFERYALWLVAPTALLAALSLDHLLTGSRIRRGCAILASLSISWCCLAAFQGYFFAAFTRTGGEGHRTYRTGSTEPKQAAYEQIVAHTPPGQTARVIVHEWWTYWPLRYISFDSRQSANSVRVEFEDAQSSQPMRRTAAPGEELWDVELYDLWSQTLHHLKPTLSLFDPLGRPVVSLDLLPGGSKKN